MAGGAFHERLEGSPVDTVSLEQVDGAPCVAVEAGVEHADGVVELGAVGEGQLDLLLVGVADGDDAVVFPDGAAHPFPLFFDVGEGVMNELTDLGELLAAPVVKLGDEVIDLL